MNRPRSRAQSVPPPPAPPSNTSRLARRSNNKRSNIHSRSPRRHREVKLLLCIIHTTSHKWSTEPIRFDPNRINDRQLWSDIRYTFRTYLQKPWRRLLGVKKVKAIVPIYVRCDNMTQGMKMPLLTVSCLSIPKTVCLFAKTQRIIPTQNLLCMPIIIRMRSDPNILG